MVDVSDDTEVADVFQSEGGVIGVLFFSSGVVGVVGVVFVTGLVAGFFLVAGLSGVVFVTGLVAGFFLVAGLSGVVFGGVVFSSRGGFLVGVGIGVGVVGAFAAVLFLFSFDFFLGGSCCGVVFLGGLLGESQAGAEGHSGGEKDEFFHDDIVFILYG